MNKLKKTTTTIYSKPNAVNENTSTLVVKTKRAPYCYLLALASGFLMALSFQVTALFWLSWLALIPLFWLLSEDGFSRKQTLLLITIYAAGFHLPLNSYILALHPLDFLGFNNVASAALLALGWLMIGLIQISWHLLMAIVYYAVRRRTAGAWLARFPLLLLVMLWLMMEWGQAFGQFGYTWGRLAIAQATVPALIQSAALGGSLLVSALILLVNALLTLALKTGRWRWLVVAVLIFAVNLGGGVLRLALNQDYNAYPTFKAAVVQGTLPSLYRSDAALFAESRRQYREQTLAAAAAGAELIIWPETALPGTLRETMPADAAFYRELAAAADSKLLIGAFWQAADGSRYNAMINISAEQSDFSFAKRRLVPFGEYMPFEGILAYILPGLTGHLSSLGIYSGSGYFVAADVPIGGLICYDSIFPQLARSSVADGAQVLVLSTNDSWFWGTQAMRQHYQQAQLRAVEQNRWLLRSANAGYSGIIDNLGRSLATIAPDGSGHITMAVPLITSNSLYFYLRDWPAYLGFIYLLAVFIQSRRNKRRS